MGCSGCGTSNNGKPSGCKSNGGCSSGGCNRMNVHDWLVNLPFTDESSVCKIIEVSFNNGSRKDFFRNTTLHNYTKGDMIAVEGVAGFDVGSVSITGELCRLQLKKNGIKEDNPDIKKILRRATENDLVKLEESKKREPEAIIRSRAIAKQLNLNMKISEVEIQADGRKATFFYIADDRVDFRELIKIYAGEFKVKVEMRQIGARQEAAKVGGIGSCGRELCCSTWLTDFKSVTTTAARYQNLSINQTKLSGQCGRLKCCLNYELDTYLDALQFFPDNADSLEFAKGRAHLIKKDIFKNLMWYTIAGSTKHYPLTIDRVREVKSLNQKNILPDEIEAVEIINNKQQEKEPEFVDVVGQISLQSLDKKDRNKRRQQQGNYNQPRNPQQRQQGFNSQQGNNPQRQQNNPQQRQQGQGNNQQGGGMQQQRQQGGNQQGGGQQRQQGQGNNQQGNRQQGQGNRNNPRPPFVPRNKGGATNQGDGNTDNKK
jgi:cell fate regulator YaaT (PSP1 superfamily)